MVEEHIGLFNIYLLSPPTETFDQENIWLKVTFANSFDALQKERLFKQLDKNTRLKTIVFTFPFSWK